MDTLAVLNARYTQTITCDSNPDFLQNIWSRGRINKIFRTINLTRLSKEPVSVNVIFFQSVATTGPLAAVLKMVSPEII